MFYKSFQSIKNNKGFTLVELLVGSVILLLLIVGVSASIAESSRISQKDLLRRRAFQEMDLILSHPRYSSAEYANLRIQALGGAPVDNWGDRNLNGTVNGTFTVTLAYSEYQLQTQAGVLLFPMIPSIRITVNSNWIGGNGQLEKIITAVRG